jgi:hypothetical protein
MSSNDSKFLILRKEKILSAVKVKNEPHWSAEYVFEIL